MTCSLADLQARQRHEKTARRHDKVQRIVQACPEVAAASQLQHLCTAVQAHVPDVEQSCIMVQWMMQEVADLGIAGISWNPAKVSGIHLMFKHDFFIASTVSGNSYQALS